MKLSQQILVLESILLATKNNNNFIRRKKKNFNCKMTRNVKNFKRQITFHNSLDKYKSVFIDKVLESMNVTCCKRVYMVHSRAQFLAMQEIGGRGYTLVIWMIPFGKLNLSFMMQ